MHNQSSDPQLWSWSEKAIASLFWSDDHACWKWGITRQTAGQWERWRAGNERSCYDACISMANAFEELAYEEGAPF